KIALALARSNGASPLTTAPPALACSPFDFMRSWRALIGSCCATTAVTPAARTAIATTGRIIPGLPLVFMGVRQAGQNSAIPRQTPVSGRYSDREDNAAYSQIRDPACLLD